MKLNNNRTERLQPMKICAFEGCGNKVRARGLCIGHYTQFNNGQELKPLGANRNRLCSFEGCGRKHASKGLCSSHYQQRLLGYEELRPIGEGQRKRVTNRDDLGRKKCSRCDEWKPESDYHAGDNPDGLSNHCKRCERDSALRKSFGIGLEEYERLLRKQNGGCAICKRSAEGYLEETGRNFCVDHDHACCPDYKKTCGQCVRGLLCNYCNSAIGYLQDDTDRLLEAATYLMASKNLLT